MNVFRVDDCPLEAARALCDAHLVSQVKEAAQLLSTAARMRAAALGAPPPDLYRATHTAHPCTLAAASSQDFALWTLRHALELDAERLRRGTRGGRRTPRCGSHGARGRPCSPCRPSARLARGRK